MQYWHFSIPIQAVIVLFKTCWKKPVMSYGNFIAWQNRNPDYLTMNVETGYNRHVSDSLTLRQHVNCDKLHVINYGANL